MQKIYNSFQTTLLLFLASFISSIALSQNVGLTATGGTLAASYNTVSDAFAAINSGTHQGDIVISINGNTTEPNVPVFLGANGVSTALYTSVLIKPSVAAVISGTPNAGSAVLNFNGSDNITIDGSITTGGTTRDLTIQNDNLPTVLNTACIRAIGQTTAGTGLGVNGFNIKNTIIIGSTPGNNGSSGNTNTTSYGIYAGSNSLTTMSSFTAGANYDNVLIENNEIKRAYIAMSIYGGAAPNQNDNLTIRGNEIGSTSIGDYVGFKGINAYQNLNALIESNTIINIRATTSINVAGIEVGGTSSNTVTVSRNRIESLYSESTGGWGCYGVNLIGGNNHIVVNNVITDIRTTNYSATSTTYNAFGIRITTGTGHKIYYNSINIFGDYTSTNWTAASSAALVVSSTVVSGLDIRNNIFNNTMTSNAGSKEFRAVWFPSSYNFANAILDYNYYGIPTDGVHYVGKVGLTLGAGNYPDLASWQAITQIGNPTNNIESEPVSNTVAPFVSNYDLTIPVGTVTTIESAGIEIPSLGLPNVDHLLTNRPLAPGFAPDMGAYEFAGFIITCPQPTTLTVVDALTDQATISWTVVGTETAWQVEYGFAGFTQGTGTTAIVTSNPTTILNLTPNSFYQFYVRGICSPGDSSLWSGPISFNTFNQGNYIEWDNTCPSSNFVDISTSGTLFTLGDDDEAPLTLPFPVLYQNVQYNTATLGNNGAIVLGVTNAQVGFSNTTITATTANGLYPFWDDLGGAGPGVWAEEIGVAPNRKYIIQWNKEHLSASGNALNFELIIEEGTNEIYYVYEDVDAGNATYNNGASATIGLAGTAQDLQVSYNNATYLSNNSCVHFYYTDCPKPSNLATSYIFADEAAFTWNPGLAGESNWTVIYGPTGFDPLTGGTQLTTTNPSITLLGLTQLTTYDLYVFADCDVTLQSNPLFFNFQTLPFCSNPSAMLNNVAIDSVFSTWSWTQSNPAYPISSFNLTYGMTGFDLYTEGTELALDNNFSDTLVDTGLLAGGVYQLYIQAVCGNDTSSYIGPFTVTMPLTNDVVCGAVLLPVDGVSYIFNNNGATVDVGENAIAPPATGAQTTTGWINSTLNNTVWYKFVAPASGNVRIDNTAINYAGQAAVYETTSCIDYNLFSFNSANDNAIGGTSVAPNWVVCGLTPGDTVYLMIDGSTAATGNYSVSITPINLNAGTFGSLLEICSGDTVNLFNGIAGFDNGGVWSAELPAANTGVSDSLFASAGLAYQIFNFEYRLTDGCAYDSIVSQVQVFGPSSAGNDGTITVCKNEPYDLLSGLTGNVDVGGTWYDPSNNALPDSWLTAGNIPGQFNYDYVTGNGICPNDTSNVLVTVNAGCDYLALGDLSFEMLQIYPNPTNGVVNISSPKALQVSIKVRDINGRLISSHSEVNLNHSLSIDLSHSERGIYLIEVALQNQIRNYRVILN
jgi:hypothetical protein